MYQKSVASVAVAFLVLFNQALAAQVTTADDPMSLVLEDLKALRRQLVMLADAREQDLKTIADLAARLDRLQREHAAQAGGSTSGDGHTAEAGITERVGQVTSDQSLLRDRIEVVENDVVSANAEAQKKLNVHVYGDVGFENFTNTTSTIDAHSIELVMDAKPHARLSFFSEVEFERAAAVGGRRGGEILLEQAHVELGVTPWLNPRVGVVLVPFGYYNQNHFAVLADFADKSLLHRVVVPSDWFDNAVGLTGQGSRNGMGWAYEAYMMNGLQQGIGNLGLRDARPPFGKDNNAGKSVAGQFRIFSGPSSRLGVSFYRGAFDDDNRQVLQSVAVDGKWETGPFAVQAEYARFSPEPGPIQAPRLLHGYNAEAKYTFWPGFLARTGFGRSFEDPKLSLGARFDEVWIDAWNVSDGNHERRTTVGLNFRAGANLVLKGDYQINRSLGVPLVRGGNSGFLTSAAFLF